MLNYQLKQIRIWSFPLVPHIKSSGYCRKTHNCTLWFPPAPKLFTFFQLAAAWMEKVLKSFGISVKCSCPRPTMAVWTMHWMCLRALALLKCIISGSHAFISGRNPAGVDRHWGDDIYNLWFRELFQTYRTCFPFDLTGMSCPVNVQTLDVRREASTIQVLLKLLRNNETWQSWEHQFWLHLCVPGLRSDSMPLLCGVTRVGLVAKGLLIKGDMDLELVLMCKEKPTKLLLYTISTNLPLQIQVGLPMPIELQTSARWIIPVNLPRGFLHNLQQELSVWVKDLKLVVLLDNMTPILQVLMCQNGYRQ